MEEENVPQSKKLDGSAGSAGEGIDADRLRVFLSHAPGVIYRCRIEGEELIPIFFSAGLEREFGIEGKELLDSMANWAARIHPEDRERALPSLSRLEECDTHEREYRLRHGDGGYRWIADRLCLVRDAAGRPVEGVGTWADISRYKDAEAALENKNRLLSAFQQLCRLTLSSLDLDQLLDDLAHQVVAAGIFRSIMIALVDQERRSVEVVRNFISITQGGAIVPRADIVPNSNVNGTRYSLDDDNITAQVARTGRMEIVDGWDDRFDRRFTQEEKTRGQVYYFIPVKQRDRVVAVLATGSIRTEKEEVLCRIEALQPLLDQVVIALEHIQLIGELEERVRVRTRELEAANERLQEMDQLKSDFIANVSHELRTPLTSIKGAVDNMIDGVVGEFSDRQDQYLERIKKNADRLTRLIEDLLDLSQIEAGKLKVHPTAWVVWNIASEAVEALQPQFAQKGVTLSLEGGGADLRAMADPDRVHEVLKNLLENALKFTPEGGGVVVRCEAEEGDLRVSVRDSGRGIPEKQLRTIFDKFHQAGDRFADRKGAGIGLAIARQLVELHGGRIWAESRMGEGSTFCFTLPLADPEEKG